MLSLAWAVVDGFITKFLLTFLFGKNSLLIAVKPLHRSIILLVWVAILVADAMAQTFYQDSFFNDLGVK